MKKKNQIVKAGYDNESGFELMQRSAKALASSTLVPDVYKDNIPNAMIAMELANRTGASILSVMQSLYIVHGNPSFSSAFLIATVNTCGRFTPLRPVFQGKKDTDDWGCRMVATDKSTGEVCEGTLITIGMSKIEGWYGRKGSKWQTMPELMLTYRAAAFWTRIYAPELSLGMHTVEEMEDVKNVNVEYVEQPENNIEKINKITDAKANVETDVETDVKKDGKTDGEIEMELQAELDALA